MLIQLSSEARSLPGLSYRPSHSDLLLKKDRRKHGKGLTLRGHPVTEENPP